eukprot:170895-Pyramimonas_sp.AAC.1
MGRHPHIATGGDIPASVTDLFKRWHGSCGCRQVLLGPTRPPHTLQGRERRERKWEWPQGRRPTAHPP